MAQNYTLPDWARLTGRQVDLRTSPYWGAQGAGDGSGTLGNGDGSGYYTGLQGMGAREAAGSLDSRGLRMMEAAQGDSIIRWLQDAQGNVAGPVDQIKAEDKKFGIGALLAGGVVGGAAAGLYGGAGAGAGGVGAGGAGSGTLAALAPTGGGAGVVAGGAGAAGGGGASAMALSDWAQIGASLAGTAVQSNAAKNAADAQRDAANNASNTQLAMFNRTTELQEPWRQAGIGALSQLATGTATGGDLNRDFTMADFNADPGMAFRMQQGQRAVESSAAARGGLLSGGTGKALVDYGQQAGSQEYGAAYNRFNADRDRRFNRLAGIAGIGQTATRDVSQAGMNTGNNIANNQMSAGNAQSAGYIAQGNAINQGIGTIGNWWQQRPQSQQPSGGSSWGSPSMNQFFYGQGTSGD